mgnify:CR=1 FL=1
MGDHIGRTNELNQTRNGGIGVRSIRHIFIADVGKVSNFFRDRLPRIYECYVPADDLAMNHTRCSNLNQLVVVERETRRLGVDNNNVFIQLTKRVLFLITDKRLLAIANALRGVFENISVKP